MKYRKETFSANTALQLLWIHHEDPYTDIGLTPEEIAHLKLEVIADWENLTCIYKERLITVDKAELIGIMSRKEEFFIR